MNWTPQNLVAYAKRRKPAIVPRNVPRNRSGYNPKVVAAYFKDQGIPEPEFEFVFIQVRKWRFDLAWPNWGMSDGVRTGPNGGLALEVQGGLWTMGRHNRGAALLKEYEKLNSACELGWRILYVQPRDLCMKETADMIKRCLEL